MGKKKVAALMEDLEDAIASGDRSLALMRAVAVTEEDPENVDALWAILNCSLPEIRRDGSYRTDPSLVEAAKGWNLSQKIVKIDPTHRGAWIRGAILLTQHLGMSEEVLQWWEEYRVHFPSDTMPIIEQAAMLMRMGLYAESSRRLSVLLEPGMDELPRNQQMRVMRMNQTVQRYYELEKLDVFKPQDSNHPAWKDINGMRNLKPSSETFTFFMLAGPLVIWEAYALKTFMPADIGCMGMAFAFFLVYASVLFVKRISISMTERRNRPVLDLWRAIEVEAISGKVCVPEEIRDSKLYRIVINKDYPVAFRQRIEKIVEADEKISKRWELTLPEWADYDIDEEE